MKLVRNVILGFDWISRQRRLVEFIFFTPRAVPLNTLPSLPPNQRSRRVELFRKIDRFDPSSWLSEGGSVEAASENHYLARCFPDEVLNFK